LTSIRQGSPDSHGLRPPLHVIEKFAVRAQGRSRHRWRKERLDPSPLFSVGFKRMRERVVCPIH
jgi:hypothetical protein